MVEDWLCDNMLSSNADPKGDAKKIVEKLGSHKETYTHSKHIHIEECKNLGIAVKSLELSHYVMDTLQMCMQKN